MAASVLAELTIVIPSFERQSYLERQVRMWGNTPVRVEILDGSAQAWHPSPDHPLPENVAYWHMPRSLGDRLGFVIDHVSTNYAVLLSDDEFYLPSALERCVERLAQDSDLVACKGLAVGFDVTATGVIGYPVYASLRGYRIDQDDPAERIFAHMSHYAMATLWAVMKADVFKKTLVAMSIAGPVGCAVAGEIQISLVTAWSGKCEVLNELMWLRSGENRNTWGDGGRLRFDQWYSDSGNAREVQRFLRAIVRAIGRHGESDDRIEGQMRRAIAAHVDQCRRQSYPRAMARLRGHATTMVPRGIKNAVKGFLTHLGGSKYPSRSRPLSLVQMAECLGRAGVRVNTDELRDIVEIIREASGVRSAVREH